MSFKLSKLPSNLSLLTFKSITPSLKLFINTGSINENKTNNGISHLIEHLIVSNKPEFNGYTTKTKTVIFKNNPIIKKDIFNIIELKLSNTNKELKRIYSEGGWNTNNKEYDIGNNKNIINFISTIENNHNKLLGFNLPIIGNKESIKNITLNNILEYFNKYYKNNNIILSIGSKYKHEDIIKLLKEYKIDREYDKFNNKKDLERTVEEIKDNKIIAYKNLLESSENDIKEYNSINITYKNILEDIIKKNVSFSNYNENIIASIKTKGYIHPLLYFISKVKDNIKYLYTIYNENSILTLIGNKEKILKIINNMFYKDKEEMIVDYIFKNNL